MKKILISALEPSANLHLSEILPNLDASICGIFDDKICNERPLYSSSEFSSMGFLNILPLIIKAKKAIDDLANLSRECSDALLIDSPDFNMILAKRMKKFNPDIKITYYILPQVWAWREGRAKMVEKYCDNLASIWPFESEFYKKSTYVGNPLLDEINVSNNPIKDRLVFMPGSRKSEIKALMPIYRNLIKKLDGKKNILVIPSSLKDNLEIYGDISGFEISYNAIDELSKAEFAFICSGTATMQATLIGVPFVLCYKTSKIDYLIAKNFVKLKHIGLANIINDFLNKDELHKEFIQDEANEMNLLSAYESYDRAKFNEAREFMIDYLKFGSVRNVTNLIMKG